MFHGKRDIQKEVKKKIPPKEKSKENAWMLCMGIIVNIACGDLFLKGIYPLKVGFYMVIESVCVTQKIWTYSLPNVLYFHSSKHHM